MSDVRVVLNSGALNQLLNSPGGDVGKALQQAVTRVDRAAKMNCPVDTGRLRSSITNRVGVEGGGLVGIVGTNVEYAPYVEFGTRYMAARSFLRPALSAA